MMITGSDKLIDLNGDWKKQMTEPDNDGLTVRESIIQNILRYVEQTGDQNLK